MKRLLIHEVGPRDGIQIEKQVVPIETKIGWIEMLMASGVDIVQAGSFVNPAKVPQMADTDAIFNYFRSSHHRREGVLLSGLVLNEKGLERAISCGVELICMGVSASDTHSRKNTGMGTDEAIARIIPMARQAIAAGRPVQLSVQSAFGCGFEGEVPRARVISIVERYLEAGLTTISLADTAGHANPRQVTELYEAMYTIAPDVEASCHFHDTYGMALANCFAALEAGVTAFESAFAGLGGCPFTKLSGGNVATEDLVHMLQRAGIRHDIGLDPIIVAAKAAEAFFGRQLPGVIHRTGAIPAGSPAEIEN
ncbi:MAG: hydroxymethylglutaryl-CoA lyase [Acidobacteria bacterium]|nr:hydroxymethylglutaryl-CoA lyase [Acidobacteriota bacterium]